MQRICAGYVIHDQSCSGVPVVNLIDCSESLAASGVPQLDLDRFAGALELHRFLIKAGVDSGFGIFGKVTHRVASEDGRLAAARSTD